MDDTNGCQATGCTNDCPATHLMCVMCWGGVSTETKRKVYSTYTSGQNIDNSRIKPAWRSAVRQAVREVQGLEDEPVAPEPEEDTGPMFKPTKKD